MGSIQAKVNTPFLRDVDNVCRALDITVPGRDCSPFSIARYNDLVTKYMYVLQSYCTT
jgi:hypothetical protein